ncbi:MAG: complex I NDUFA9 subunit family protein [Pseudomonadota bacterium]
MPEPKTEKLVTLIGGSGFIGRHIVRALAREGYRVRVACRRPDLAGHLQPLGNLGQIQMIQANIRYPESLEAACRDSFAVINLVGLLANSGKQTFDACHVDGAEACAKAAREAGAEVFIQMSAIGADPKGNAIYARTKAEGEELAAANFPGATILRPSIVFGPEDGFFNKFGAMARFSPALPLIGWGVTRFQPVFVGDVAKAVTAVLEDWSRRGKTYELGGPEVFTFKQLLKFVLETTHRTRLLVPIPFAIAKIKAMFLQLLPYAPLTVDQVRLLEKDNVVSEAAAAEGRTLEGLGIEAEGIDAIVPTYLARYRPAGQFDHAKTA